MRTHRFLAIAFLLVLLAALPAAAQKREVIQLQTQVQVLQDQMARMQQTFDERMGIMRSLIEQSTDNMNKITSAVEALSQAVQTQQRDEAARMDQLALQLQALHDSLDELKVRFARADKQLEQLAAQREQLPAQGPLSHQAPPADVLYNDALRDYNAGKNELAMQEFQDYLKYYSTTELAGNAQFYIADIHYRQGDYKQAVAEYDKVLEQFPGNNKVAAAQLKKGFALLELGQRDAGIRELNSLIARYPRSIEAGQAQERLRKLQAGRTPARRSTPR